MSRLIRLFLLFVFSFVALSVSAQKDSIPADLPKADNGEAPAMPISIEVGKSWYKGDSIPAVIFPAIYKYPPLDFANEKERQNYSRLVQNVKLLLPLAKMARATIVETYDYIQTLPTKKERQAHIDAVEAGLKKEYTPMLNRLSRSQGRLLVKLIDRETNQTGYQIAKAFVGAFKANLYQGISFFFGLNLNKTTIRRATTATRNVWYAWWRADNSNPPFARSQGDGKTRRHTAQPRRLANGSPRTLPSFDRTARNLSLKQAIFSPARTQKQLSTSIRHVLSCLSLLGGFRFRAWAIISSLAKHSTYHIIHKIHLFADS